MKTTIELPKSLLSEAKACASREGTTLRALIEAGLRSVLKERKRKKKTFKLRDVSYGSGGLLPPYEWKDVNRMIRDSYGDRGGDPE